jgi:hypothetical protein
LERIRVLLAGLPRMLRDIVVDVVATQPDLEIVGEATNEGAIADVSGPIEVLILASRGAAKPSRYSEHLYRRPQMRILAIVDESRRGFLFELQPVRLPLGELSPVTLLAAIRNTGAISHRP